MKPNMFLNANYAILALCIGKKDLRSIARKPNDRFHLRDCAGCQIRLGLEVPYSLDDPSASKTGSGSFSKHFYTFEAGLGPQPEVRSASLVFTCRRFTGSLVSGSERPSDIRFPDNDVQPFFQVRTPTNHGGRSYEEGDRQRRGRH